MIFLLHGPDTFRSRAKLGLLKDKFLAINPEGSVITREGEELTSAEFSELISPSLFTTKRFIVIENILQSGNDEDQARMVGLLDGAPEGTFLVFWEDNDAPKDSPLGGKLGQVARIDHFNTLSPAELMRWTIAQASRLGVILSSQAAQYIVSLCEENAWRIDSELKKLAGIKGEPITLALIDSLVAKPLVIKAFDLLDAISAGNVSRANELVTKLWLAGEEPIRFLGLLAYNFRALIWVQDLLTAGKSQSEIVRLTKLKQYAVSQAVGKTAKLPREWIVSSYQQLAESDALIKAGQRDAEEELSQLVVKLAHR